MDTLKKQITDIYENESLKYKNRIKNNTICKMQCILNEITIIKNSFSLSDMG